MDLVILLPEHKEIILEFCKRRLAERERDPMEREIKSWSARWRAEALEHYLKLGWSYGAFVQGQLKGIVLGQPFVFHRGLTQTLWLEHLEGESEEIKAALLDCASRWARDKHFQCVLMETETGELREIKTARYQ